MLTGPIFKYLSGGLGIALLIFIGLWKMEQRHARKADEQLHACSEARKADRQSYEQAQRDAQAKNKADIQRIETKQKEITDEVQDRYSRDLAELRRLRASGTAKSPASGPGASQVPDAPAKPDEKELRLPPNPALRGAELELQLNSLIDWVNKQLAAQ